MHSACASSIGTWQAVHLVRDVTSQEPYRVPGCDSKRSEDGISNPREIRWGYTVLERGQNRIEEGDVALKERHACWHSRCFSDHFHCRVLPRDYRFRSFLSRQRVFENGWRLTHSLSLNEGGVEAMRVFLSRLYTQESRMYGTAVVCCPHVFGLRK